MNEMLDRKMTMLLMIAILTLMGFLLLEAGYEIDRLRRLPRFVVYQGGRRRTREFDVRDVEPPELDPDVEMARRD